MRPSATPTPTPGVLLTSSFPASSRTRHDAPFLAACRREPTARTPIWLLRQAGRYQAFYREIRRRVSILELCKTPDLVAEVTVRAAVSLGVDAAIVFSDLLLPAEAMGLTLTFTPGDGPRLAPAIRDAGGVDTLPELDPEALAYAHEGVRRSRAALPPELPLLGFAGAPFTLASYIIEGGASRHFEHTKRFFAADEGTWHALLGKLARGTAAHLQRQIEAGADAVQLFDSWAGCLSAADYRRYAKPHTQAVLAALPPGIPVIHFGTGTGAFLRDFREAGGDVLGVDWRVDLDRAWEEIGHDRAIMGNLDPVTLLGPWERVASEARRILGLAARRPGHVFNLGHGVLPGTPEDQVRRLVDLVHEVSAR
jgi:uroporphyrinogen decarboxylase